MQTRALAYVEETARDLRIDAVVEAREQRHRLLEGDEAVAVAVRQPVLLEHPTARTALWNCHLLGTKQPQPHLDQIHNHFHTSAPEKYGIIMYYVKYSYVSQAHTQKDTDYGYGYV